MLATSLELSLYAFITSFCGVYGTKLLDLLLDYPMYWWRIRYRFALKAAQRIGKEDYLKDALANAIDSEDDKATIMDAAYQHIANRDRRFKLWACIYCLTIRISAYGALIGCVILWPVFGPWVALYFFMTFSFVAFLFRM